MFTGKYYGHIPVCLFCIQNSAVFERDSAKQQLRFVRNSALYLTQGEISQDHYDMKSFHYLFVFIYLYYTLNAYWITSSNEGVHFHINIVYYLIESG